MHPDSVPSAPPVADPPAVPDLAHRPRRPHLAALFDSGAFVVTTALLVVSEPKLPPFSGD
ncbi:hypothetical protein [Nonomuraea sp. NPDC003804]|uniref:hypothetical protein n=1 Tax=Nonomuraea sp. NPDC003804 TaxID=3154547 RepID=UPI0033A7ED7F